MILVDTSVWIAQIRNAETRSVLRLREEAAKANVLTADLVLLEVLRGARDDRHATFLEAQLRQFRLVSVMSDGLAIVAASRYRHLRALGITIRSLADLIIASYCIEHGHALLHDDRDFRPMVDHFGLREA